MVNEFFEFKDYGGTLSFYVFELANFSTLAIFALILYHCKYINVNSLIVWVGLFFVPLLLNYFALSPMLFPDQFTYTKELVSLKSTGMSSEAILANNDGNQPSVFSIAVNPVTLATRILGLAPIPNFMTLTSLAFANKFFLFLTFLWVKKYFHNENVLLLAFLIPSVVLFSSLSLRDNLVIIFSMIFLINMLRGKPVLALLFAYPLITLKIQMLFVLMLYFIGSIFFKANKSFFRLGIFTFVILCIAIIFEETILEIINHYRYGFFAENLVIGDGGRGYAAFGLYAAQFIDALTLDSIFEVFLVALKGLPRLMVMPLPWNWDNVLYPIQFVESILLAYLYYWIPKRYNILQNKEFIFLTYCLVFGLMIYSLLVFNEGTFIRYRFALFYPFIFAVFYLGQKTQGIEK